MRKIEDITKFSARAEKKKIHLNFYVRIEIAICFLLDFLLVGFLEQIVVFLMFELRQNICILSYKYILRKILEQNMVVHTVLYMVKK